jgi:DNA-binding NarL/FixJ family response regulator
MNKIKIILVDDHEVVRGGIRRLLEQVDRFQVVAEASSGEEAYHLMAEMNPDVVVMDISMSGMSGIETIRKIRLRGDRVKLLMFSVHESANVVQRALDAGANGYLSKASAGDEIVDAVTAISAGKRYLGADVARKLADMVLTYEPSSASEKLTRREFEVLRLFSAGNSIEELAKVLHISPKTVANSLSSIKSKLGVRTQAELMRVALERGIDSSTI